jgi:hypothetical protein
MNEHRIGYVVGMLAGVILLGGIIARTLITPRADHEISIDPVAREDIAAVPRLMAPIAQRTSSDKSPTDGSQSNVLELPRASLYFVGYWGGYTHSTIFSVVPGEMTGENPDRASVVFGHTGDTVLIATELYAGAGQRLIGRPSARISNPREAVIHYRSEDSELEYEYDSHFRLIESGRISFRNRVIVYSRRSRERVGTVEQQGMLSRLLTMDEQWAFARPSSHEVPKSEILTRKNFSAFGSEREGHTAVVTADPGE